jgi:hypothetical protein
MRIPYLFAACALAAGLWQSPADASSSQLPTPRVQRTLTAPDGSIRLDAGERWPYYDAQFKHVLVEDGEDAQFLNPGLSFGVSSDTEFGFVVPYRLSPNDDFEDPRIHILHQFDQGRVDVGLFGGLRLGVFDQWLFTGGVPILFHWNSHLRLDTGGFFVVNFGQDASLSLRAPAEFVFQITPQFFLGPETGVNLNNLFNNGFDLNVPLGGVIGYTIATSGGTLGDMYGRVRILDIEAANQVVELMLGLEFYFDT